MQINYTGPPGCEEKFMYVECESLEPGDFSQVPQMWRVRHIITHSGWKLLLKFGGGKNKKYLYECRKKLLIPVSFFQVARPF
jgi:hypothetical protein